MKNILIITLMLLSMSAFSQKLVITPEGLKNSDNLTKNYIVVDIEGTSSELYSKTNNYIQRNYKNPNRVIKGSIDDKLITFSTHANKIARTKKNIRPIINLDYSTQIEFKENKIKIEIIDIDLYYYHDNSRMPVKFCCGGNGMYISSIYNKNGGLYLTYTKEDVEKYLNNHIQSIITTLNNSTEEDW